MIICLTGVQRVGKTALLSALIENLQYRKINVEGFFTEVFCGNPFSTTPSEIRICTLDDDVAVVAKKSLSTPFKYKKFYVDLEALERLTLPLLEKPYEVMVIDELTKMETISENFKKSVEKIMNECKNDKKKFLFAVVPLKTGDEFIKNVIQNADQVFCMTQNNCLHLLDDIIDTLESLLRSKRRRLD